MDPPSVFRVTRLKSDRLQRHIQCPSFTHFYTFPENVVTISDLNGLWPAQRWEVYSRTRHTNVTYCSSAVRNDVHQPFDPAYPGELSEIQLC